MDTESKSVLARLSLGWKLALSAIAVVVLVLVVAVGFVSLRLWQDAHADATQLLQNTAAASSSVMQVYDDTARKAAVRDFALFKAGFDEVFTLAESSAREGRPVPQLSNRGRPLNGNLDIVDQYTHTVGAVATIFVRTGDDFLRITTSLHKGDGSRAMGTLLDRQHPAYHALIEGRPYTGRATLFGKTYMTHYEPIRQADRTIGVLFVGTDMTDLLAAMAGTMAAQHPFAGSAVFAVDVHPGPALGQIFGTQATAKLDASDPAAGQFLQQMRAAGTAGSFQSQWTPAGSGAGAQGVAVVKNDTWDWVLVCEAPVSAMMAKTVGTLTLLWASILAAIVALLVAILWLSQRMVGAPVAELAHTLTRLAEGDLSRSVEIRSQDEIGRLSRSMENFRIRIVQMLAGVRENAHFVATASAQIASGNNDLSSRTEQQAAALEQTSATMQELHTTVNNNARDADRANALAASATEVANRGGQVVERVVRTMHDIDGSSKKIAEIISVIDGIAFQTNILALNAAVEAARAGPQGRGFAVVATEVRSLAQRSAVAAKDIKNLIHSTVEQVQQGSVLVQNAGQTMTEIVHSVREVSAIIGAISAASTEQSNGVAQVGEAVHHMDHATQQNAALVEQSAAAAHSLKEQADVLVQAVSVFKLDPAQHAEPAVA